MSAAGQTWKMQTKNGIVLCFYVLMQAFLKALEVSLIYKQRQFIGYKY